MWSCKCLLIQEEGKVTCTNTLVFHSILFIVSLAIHSVAMHRHRARGGHCAPGSSAHHENGFNHNNDIALSGGPVQSEKQQPAPSYAAVPQQHQQQQPQHQQYAIPTPPQGQAPYQPPPASSPQPYHGQQQHMSPVATGQQQAGGFGAPAPHPGSHEASAGQPQY